MELVEGAEVGCCQGFTPHSAIKILTVLKVVDEVGANRVEETTAAIVDSIHILQQQYSTQQPKHASATDNSIHSVQQVLHTQQP